MVLVAVEGGPPIDADALETDAQRVLAALGRGDAELSLVLADDAFVRPLNLEWRGIDAPTDVLSFPQDDPHVLGDVVVSTETAARQAAALGHGLEVEVRVLLVHGVLHLLGHDHEDEEEARAMQGEERRLLDELGVGAEALVRRV